MDKGLKDFFWDYGYLTIDSLLSTKILSSLLDQLVPIWVSKNAPKGILNFEIQDRNLKNGSNRLQDLWTVIPEVKELAINSYILNILEFLFDDKPKPFQTLNFPEGTQQSVHSDALHFNSEPFGKMCGVWIALEDIKAESGPLFYYPKSHHLPELSEKIMGFHPTFENYSKVIDYWQNQIRVKNLQRKEAIIKKGQALIWHANLLHGGMPRIDSSLSRHSQVTHYYFGEAKPWRQMESTSKMQYFEPNWIPISKT